jgi:hypothetical protein
MRPISWRAFAVGVIFGSAMLGSAAFAAATLNVNPGLWEVSLTGGSFGGSPIPNTVRKQCVTRVQLQQGLELKNEPGEKCRYTLLTNTGTVMEVKATCNGQDIQTTVAHFEARDSQTVVGYVDMTGSLGGNTVTVKRQLAARWLNADCGAFKDK